MLYGFSIEVGSFVFEKIKSVFFTLGEISKTFEGIFIPLKTIPYFQGIF
jgi:hypothetical protein